MASSDLISVCMCVYLPTGIRLLLTYDWAFLSSYGHLVFSPSWTTWCSVNFIICLLTSWLKIIYQLNWTVLLLGQINPLLYSINCHIIHTLLLLDFYPLFMEQFKASVLAAVPKLCNTVFHYLVSEKYNPVEHFTLLDFLLLTWKFSFSNGEISKGDVNLKAVCLNLFVLYYTHFRCEFA